MNKCISCDTLINKLKKIIDESEKINPSVSNQEDMMGIKIDNLNLSYRIRQCLKSVGIETVSDLSKLSWYDIRQIKNIGGKQCVDKIAKVLSDLGIQLKKNIQDNDDYHPVIEDRTPTIFDNEYSIGQQWIARNNNTVWTLRRKNYEDAIWIENLN